MKEQTIIRYSEKIQTGTMKTPPTSEFPEIIWDRGDHVDNHDQLDEYCASGESDDGRKWGGSWIEIHGEFTEITHIEEV